MTEIPTAPSEPTPPPVSATRSQRRLIIGVAAVLVTAVAATVAVLLAFGAWGAQPPVLYTSEAEHYSVMAPGEPTQELEPVVQPLAIPATVSHWTDGDLYYAVVTADGKDLPPTPVWRGAFLHDVLVGALRDAPGVSAADLESTAVTEAFQIEPDEITLSGDPAYRFSLTLDEATAPLNVVFAAHGTLLYLVVYSESDDSRDDDFLDSFAFVD